MIPVGPAIAVALALRPVVVRLARAARQDSPGGKRITREEVGEILLGAAPAVLEAIDGQRCPACDGRPATSCPVCGAVA